VPHLGSLAKLLWRLHVSVVDPTPSPCIYVLAGANGSGKSSLVGALFGQNYFNPDVAAQAILSKNPGITLAEANSAAWHEGLRLLQRAITERLSFAFETTLGGRSITSLLQLALSEGMEVRVWYAGLSSPELNIARVRSRVARGGHDIPEAKIRERYNASRKNLVRLLPKLTELRVYDNSDEADLKKGVAPEPKLILHMVRGTLVSSCDLTEAPEWAKPILMIAVYTSRVTTLQK
jgi:predicted ABC-type ATPase